MERGDVCKGGIEKRKRRGEEKEMEGGKEGKGECECYYSVLLHSC